MHVAALIVGGIGVVLLIIGGLIWFSPQDDDLNKGMADVIALLPLGLGGVLLLIALFLGFV